MLSIIICSRRPRISSMLEKNLEDTVDTDYELIVVDNSKQDYTIFEAYNKGMDKSTGDILVFLHDDVFFHTRAWGKKVETFFNDNKRLGLLGVAGSTAKTKMPSTWWTGPGKNYAFLIQHYKKESPPKNKNEGFENKGLVEVAVIDGVFMAMKANDKILFSENIEGFHNYDLDLSLQHFLQGNKICVTNEILIEHFSGGILNKEWYLSTSQFHKKNWKFLPIASQTHFNEKMKQVEFSSGAEFVIGLMKFNFYREAMYWWFKLILMKPISKFHIQVLRQIFKNNPRYESYPVIKN